MRYYIEDREINRQTAIEQMNIDIIRIEYRQHTMSVDLRQRELGFHETNIILNRAEAAIYEQAYKNSVITQNA